MRFQERRGASSYAVNSIPSRKNHVNVVAAESRTADETGLSRDEVAGPRDTTGSTESRAQPEASRGSGGLDLMSNDSQFYIIANLIVSRYEDDIRARRSTIALSAQDKAHFDRITSKARFVEALRYRLKNSRASSGNSSTTLEKCRVLGLHEFGIKNVLFAPVGSKITLQYAPAGARESSSTTGGMSVASSSVTRPRNGDVLARKQLLAELQEASNLMAESVTPEATAFWRKHVVDLQSRLRALHEDQPCASHSIMAEEEVVLKKNDRMLERLEKAGAKTSDGTVTTNSILANPADEPSQAEFLASLENEFNDLQAKNEGYLNQVDPEIQNVPMVDVVAPANLPEGYTFEAEINNKRFLAMVPAGGVRKGQTFSCFMRDVDAVADIPEGKWRDGLFSLADNGTTHPMLWTPILCPLLALAQVMTRMGLDFTGRPNTEVPRKGMWSTWGMAFTIIGFWSILNALVLSAIRFKNIERIPTSSADFASLAIINLGMVVYVAYAAYNTRQTIRERYSVEERNFVGDPVVDDIITSAACLPCSVAQMGRHTISYEKHEGRWCSDTGLAPGVESDLTSRKQAGSYRIW